jgi:hypothetical protein
MRDRDLAKVQWCLEVQAIPWAQSLKDAEIPGSHVDIRKAKRALILVIKERERLKRNRERRANNNLREEAEDFDRLRY